MSMLVSNLGPLASSLLAAFASAAVPSLALTLAVELPVAAALGLRRKLELAAVVCVNLITNPILVWLVYAASALNNADWPYDYPWSVSPLLSAVVFVGLEAVVVVVEWRLLVWALKKPSRQMLWVSIAMNAASAVAGVALARWVLLGVM